MRFLIHPLFILTAVLAVIFAATDFLIALTVAVILHELAHALVAKQFGAMVARITLTPFGGALNLQSKVLTPYQHRLIYLAGPIASLVLSLLFGVMVWLFPSFFMHLEYLVVANFMVGVINLLPIYPLDGGKVLAQLIPAKVIWVWSNLVFVLILLVALFLKNWWWSFFAVAVLLQINWDFKQSIYVDKFNYTSKIKTGKFVHCAVLGGTTLFNAYKMINKKYPTEFVVTDMNNITFCENDLEQWLMEFPLNQVIKQCIKKA